MPEQPFDVRKAIDQSASKSTLQELDRLVKEFSQDKATLSTRESDLRAEFAQREREYNKRIQDEIQKNADMSQKMAASLETSRSHEDDLFKKMEVLFAKSLEGVNKKLTDLRLRSIAGGPMGGG